MKKRTATILLLALLLSLTAIAVYSYIGRSSNQNNLTPISENEEVVDDNESECVRAGCSGELCVEASEAENTFTTCEFRPEYECYQQATCTRLETGECGFVEDRALLECLDTISQEPSLPL